MKRTNFSNRWLVFVLSLVTLYPSAKAAGPDPRQCAIDILGKMLAFTETGEPLAPETIRRLAADARAFLGAGTSLPAPTLEIQDIRVLPDLTEEKGHHLILTLSRSVVNHSGTAIGDPNGSYFQRSLSVLSDPRVKLGEPTRTLFARYFEGSDAPPLDEFLRFWKKREVGLQLEVLNREFSFRADRVLKDREIEGQRRLRIRVDQKLEQAISGYGRVWVDTESGPVLWTGYLSRDNRTGEEVSIVIGDGDAVGGFTDLRTVKPTAWMEVTEGLLEIYQMSEEVLERALLSRDIRMFDQHGISPNYYLAYPFADEKK